MASSRKERENHWFSTFVFYLVLQRTRADPQQTPEDRMAPTHTSKEGHMFFSHQLTQISTLTKLPRRSTRNNILLVI